MELLYKPAEVTKLLWTTMGTKFTYGKLPSISLLLLSQRIQLIVSNLVKLTSPDNWKCSIQRLWIFSFIHLSKLLEWVELYLVAIPRLTMALLLLLYLLYPSLLSIVRKKLFWKVENNKDAHSKAELSLSETWTTSF